MSKIATAAAAIGLMALVGCQADRNDANLGSTTGTDAASDVAATGDATAGTTASPAGTPATGTTGAPSSAAPAP